MLGGTRPRQRPSPAPNRGSDALAPGFRTDPYWWDAAPRQHEAQRTVPATTDVAIVGSGYTGLSAALTLSRAGTEVTVIEQGSVGSGASSRNFGMLGRQLKYDFTTLIPKFGLERAKELYEGCNRAFAFVNGLIEREKIDCFHAPSGRYIAANTPAHMDALERELSARKEHFGHAFHMVPRDEQQREIVTAKFLGGAVIPEHRTVHPGLFHNGLAERVRQAGAAIHSGTRVLTMRREDEAWLLETDRGPIKAKHLIAATNGYTGKATPWLRRRIVPIRAYMIATEPLDPAVIAAVMPGRRGFHDCAREMEYARVAPDGSRLIYGALTGEAHDDLSTVALRLREKLLKLFPQLGVVRVSHAWTGQCAGTFDYFPHRGSHDGMHYAMGYCFGAGMPFGTWLGDATARGILGERATTPLDRPEMPANPLYWGRPWFLPFYIRYQGWLDWKDGVRN
ncbi:FAD-dependent oxidoreductase [Mesorhizobium sp. KR9-304]|uniref:NAD(P)/FAD-dependent oxidoreductase n=1 Tax=Mesorhizobium sp. KR9-304 TaxID=3156614 RepID=UPI0032B4B01C